MQKIRSLTCIHLETHLVFIKANTLAGNRKRVPTFKYSNMISQQIVTEWIAYYFE